MRHFAQADVSASLDNARANGYDFVGMTTEEIAVDLGTYDAAFEGADGDELKRLKECVLVWQAAGWAIEEAEAASLVESQANPLQDQIDYARILARTALLAAFPELHTGSLEDWETRLGDLLANLAHLADELGLDFDDALKTGLRNADAERRGES